MTATWQIACPQCHQNATIAPHACRVCDGGGIAFLTTAQFDAWFLHELAAGRPAQLPDNRQDCHYGPPA